MAALTATFGIQVKVVSRIYFNSANSMHQGIYLFPVCQCMNSADGFFFFFSLPAQLFFFLFFFLNNVWSVCMLLKMPKRYRQSPE